MLLLDTLILTLAGVGAFVTLAVWAPGANLRNPGAKVIALLNSSALVVLAVSVLRRLFSLPGWTVWPARAAMVGVAAAFWGQLWLLRESRRPSRSTIRVAVVTDDVVRVERVYAGDRDEAEEVALAVAVGLHGHPIDQVHTVALD